MQYRVVVNPFVITPDQIVLSLVVMEYRTVIVPAHVRVMTRLDILVLEGLRPDRQPLERDVN